MNVTILILSLFVGYRMFKFILKEKSVKIMNHQKNQLGIYSNGIFKLEYGADVKNIKCDINFNLYSFTLLYKEFFINGEYILNEDLSDANLKRMIIQYEAKNGKLNNKKYHTFSDYRYKAIQSETPKFFFEVGYVMVR
jgi:hypothetical protein